MPPYLLTRGLHKDSPWVIVIFFAAMILFICFTMASAILCRNWMEKTDARAAERRQQEQRQVLEAEDDQQRAPDTVPSRTAQPMGGGGGHETRHGRVIPPVAANIRPATTEPVGTPTRTSHVRERTPSPPPAYNSLEPNVQPRARTAPPHNAAPVPLDLYGVPAAHLDSSNSPAELLAVHLREGERIGQSSVSGQHDEHGSAPRRDRVFYLASFRFRAVVLGLDGGSVKAKMKLAVF
ncbi:hypothetical protein GALMADRAFT_254841 [Galerina marginata CBS 339.88]|uniref:Uncharacterized protein n=1 Tax=Galerina marginata (strain CBS 339.88) TaxID=685588 RepID=A0A067SRQ9_GALM3|nr:hypothetical protein GALMADRAFT_254841 [Galerina marginata CBS 339.88]